MTEEKSLGQRLESIEEALLDILPKKKAKDKAFALPFGMQTKAKQGIKSNKILVFYLRINGFMKPLMAKIQDGMIHIQNKTYDVQDISYFFLYRGKLPCLIMPEWSIQPFGTKDYFDAVKEKRVQDPQQLMIRMFEKKEAGMLTNKLGGKAIIWIIIAVVVVGYLIFGGGL